MQIKANSIYRIAGYQNTINLAWRQRLLVMGIIPGEFIKVIRMAPLGDPVQIRTRRMNLAVRQQDLASVLLEEITA